MRATEMSRERIIGKGQIGRRKIRGSVARLTAGRGWIVELSNTTDGKDWLPEELKRPSVYITELARGRKQILTTERLTKET
jgi:hypothetical protein